jgi:hypothetical protein
MSQLEDDDPTGAPPPPGHPVLDGGGLDANAPTMQPDPDNLRGTPDDPQRQDDSGKAKAPAKTAQSTTQAKATK